VVVVVVMVTDTRKSWSFGGIGAEVDMGFGFGYLELLDRLEREDKVVGVVEGKYMFLMMDAWVWFLMGV
jgi:hypothetical protein